MNKYIFVTKWCGLVIWLVINLNSWFVFYCIRSNFVVVTPTVHYHIHFKTPVRTQPPLLPQDFCRSFKPIPIRVGVRLCPLYPSPPEILGLPTTLHCMNYINPRSCKHTTLARGRCTPHWQIWIKWRLKVGKKNLNLKIFLANFIETNPVYF